MGQLRKLHAIPTQKAQAASLAVGVCMMTRDRKHPVKFGFQMLPYSFLDARNNSESCKKFTDTPMWNSMLSSRITPMTKVDPPGPIISITRRWKQIALRVCPLHITCYKSIP